MNRLRNVRKSGFGEYLIVPFLWARALVEVTAVGSKIWINVQGKI